MKKILNIFIILLILISTVGCNKSKEVEKKTEDGELRITLKDKIKAKTKIVKIGDTRTIRIIFDRKKEDEKVNVNLKFYQNSSKEPVYEEIMTYIFPSKEIECLLEIPITESYLDVNGEKVNVRYDYIKLEISEYKEK